MYLVIIAWLYVALMMAVAESQHPAGGWFSALVTFVLYGLAPLALVVYLLRTPHRRRQAREREGKGEQRDSTNDVPAPAAGSASTQGAQADGGGHAAGDPVPPERKEG